MTERTHIRAGARSGLERRVVGRGHADTSVDHAQQLLRAVYLSHPDAVFVLSDDSPPVVLDCNPRAEAFLGFPRQELIGRAADFLYADDGALTGIRKRRLPEPAGHDGFHLFEFRMRRKDGTVLDTDHYVAPLTGEEGKRVGWVTLVRGNIERKRSETHIRFQAELLDSVRESVTATDLEGNVVYWGKGAEQLYGYGAREVLGKSVTFIVEPHEEAEEQERMRQVQQTGSWSGTYQQRRKDGSKFWADTVISLVKDGSGEPCGLVGIDRDVTTREEAMEELDRIFKLSLDVLCVVGLDGYCRRVNPAAERLFGYPESESLSRPLVAFVHPEDRDRMSDGMAKLAQGSSLVDYRLRVVAKDGSFRWVSWAAVPHLGEGLVYAVGRDVTERLQMEQELKTAHADLEERVRQRTAELLRANAALEQEIADRKKAEAALRLAQFAMDRTADAVFWIQSDGQLSYVNDAACKMLGYTHSELSSKRLYELDSQITVDRWIENWETMHAVAPCTIESEFRAKDGSLVPVEVTGNYLQFEGDEYVCATARDIAERKRIEKEVRKLNEDLERRVAERTAAIQESERKYRDLADLLPQTVFETDLDGRLSYANRAAFENFGYNKADFARGVNVLETVAEECHAIAKRNFAHVLGGQRLRGSNYTMIRKDETTFPGVVFSSPVLRAGQVVGARGIIVDMSEQKRAEAALRHEKEFAESLIEAALTIVLVLDNQGHIVRCNPYLEKLTGYRLEEIQGKDWFTIFLPEARRSHSRQLFREMVSGRDVSTGTNIIRTKDGGQRTIEWSNRTLKTDRKEPVGVLAVGHDITDLKEAQRQALQSERLAAIGQMVTGLTHESGNALQRTQACLEMLALKVEGRPEALGLIHRIQDAQDRLHKLYREVQQYAGPIVLHREPVRLSDIIQRAWSNLDPGRAGRVAKLRDSGTRKGDVCHIDPDAVERTLQNIFGNSLDACSDPVEIVIRRKNVTLDGRPAIELAVRDNGPGLSVEQPREIFEPFFTTRTRGTGLGMAISKRIVEAHGGHIQVGRDCAGGAEIVITLPKY